MAESIRLSLAEQEVKGGVEDKCTCFDSGGNRICWYCMRESQKRYWNDRRGRSSK